MTVLVLIIYYTQKFNFKHILHIKIQHIQIKTFWIYNNFINILFKKKKKKKKKKLRKFYIQ